jgi:hypothetical protein
VDLATPGPRRFASWLTGIAVVGLSVVPPSARQAESPVGWQGPARLVEAPDLNPDTGGVKPDP